MIRLACQNCGFATSINLAPDIFDAPDWFAHARHIVPYLFLGGHSSMPGPDRPDAKSAVPYIEIYSLQNPSVSSGCIAVQA